MPLSPDVGNDMEEHAVSGTLLTSLRAAPSAAGERVPHSGLTIDPLHPGIKVVLNAPPSAMGHVRMENAPASNDGYDDDGRDYGRSARRLATSSA